MIVLSLLSEIIASMLAVISPVISNKTVLAFIFAGIIKTILLVTFDADKDYKTVITTSVISFAYYVGIILKLILNIPVNQMYKEALSGAVGIVIGIVVCKLLYSAEQKILNNSKSGIYFIIAIVSLLTVICLLYRKFNSGNGDGSIKIISITFQLPEAIKVMLVIGTYIVSALMTKKKENIYYFYITSIVTCLILGFVFKELGTLLIIVYYTLGTALLLSNNRRFKLKSKNKVLQFISSEITPCILGALFFVAVKIIKNILYNQYPLRGAEGERVYGQSNRRFYISERLWADAPQTTEARNIMKNTPYIQLNLNPDIKIPNCKPETAISDYCTVVLAQGFGKCIAVILLTGIVILLIYTFLKSDYLGKSASFILISQIGVQVCGIMGFCFTGVNIPFISAGASSMFSSFILITFIIFSIRRKDNE